MKLTKKLEDRMRIHKNKLFSKDLNELLDSRPELNVVNYRNGHIEITNSFVAVRAKDVLEEKDHIENNSFTKQDKMDKIFDIDFDPKKDFQAIISTKHFEDLTDDLIEKDVVDTLFFNITDFGKNAILTIDPKTMDRTVELKTIVESIETKGQTKDKSDSVSFILNLNFFNQAMNFFRMLGVKSVSLVIEGPNKPVHLMYKNIHYVIAPITNR